MEFWSFVAGVATGVISFGMGVVIGYAFAQMQSNKELS